MSKLSVAILTFNEEKNIRDCLESVRWADEIILVDEKSTDRTVEIAKKYTKKIFFVDHGTSSGKTHDTMFHAHKQLALDKCLGDWIFQIDADERLSPELAAEIKKILQSGSEKFAGYQVPRKNHVFGKWLRYTGWYPDYQIKLFRKGQGRYPIQSVHEQIELSGPVGTLTEDLLHEHYQSLEQFVDRMNRYTTNDAGYILSKGESVTWADAIKYPADEFLKRFFYWEGYKDGLHGLVLSLLQSFSRFVVFAKIWEKQKYWEYPGKDLRRDVISEVKKTRANFWHWVAVTENNPLRKIKYKILKKTP